MQENTLVVKVLLDLL